MSTQAEVFDALARERRWQDAKRGKPERRKLPLNEWIKIAKREQFEADSALVSGDPEHCREELLQVAAVLVAALEAHGVVERPELRGEG